MWTQEELHGGIMLFKDIMTASGTMLEVYLGPGGAFAHMATCDDPLSVCYTLKDTLRITRLQLYSDEQGLYDLPSDTFSDPIPPEEVQELALTFVDGSEIWLDFNAGDIKRMGERLIYVDAFMRGRYRSSDGKEYRLRGTGFQQLSDVDPNALFYLTLFGGVLGAHRFYMGKNLTGFLYVITGGLATFGWAIDLFFLFFGLQRDKHKRLVTAPSHRLGKLLLVPVGFCINVLILLVVRSVLSGLLTG